MEVLKNHPDVTAFAISVAHDEGIKTCAIIDVKTNEKGEGYLGQIFMVTVKDTITNKEFNFVIKSAFKDDNIRKYAPIRKSFLNEIYFYVDVYPQLKKIETQNGVSPSDFVPKCYKVSTEEKTEMLCLENLKMSNFEIFDKSLILDDEHVSFIFKTYGDFHAYGFALKEQRPEEYLQLTNKLDNVYAEMITNPDGSFDTYLKSFNTLIEKYFVIGEDDELIRRYEKYLGDGIVDIFKSLVTEDCDYSSILHGDCWSNNMMFKYDVHNTSKRLTTIRLLDLQLVKTGSPVCDLSYCLYSGASKEIFDNLDKYLKIYYDSLSTTLNEFGLESEKIFPFHVLKEHWKMYAKFGMIMSLVILRMKCTNKEDLIDFTDDFEKDMTEEQMAKLLKFNEDDFKVRVKDLLKHLCEIEAL
ncbi:hypothetical protein Zmor_011631 [Zophobas morio]|uniref:CHK kinase-like domain-containing protein n=1 Tax=Zophobas morio TaxID=2755281 RepID=A0AA38IRF6_9CUCU|nr:hypothetical protein Zmor_011631 [Zophobas morio]